RLDLQIDADLISNEYPLSLVISPDLFLKNVVMPVLPSSFRNTNSETFAFNNGRITNTHHFDLPGVKKGAITYTPSVDSLSITINDDALYIEISGDVGLHMPNAYMTYGV